MTVNVLIQATATTNKIVYIWNYNTTTNLKLARNHDMMQRGIEGSKRKNISRYMDKSNQLSLFCVLHNLTQNTFIHLGCAIREQQRYYLFSGSTLFWLRSWDIHIHRKVEGWNCYLNWHTYRLRPSAQVN